MVEYLVTQMLRDVGMLQRMSDAFPLTSAAASFGGQYGHSPSA